MTAGGLHVEQLLTGLLGEPPARGGHLYREQLTQLATHALGTAETPLAAAWQAREVARQRAPLDALPPSLQDAFRTTPGWKLTQLLNEVARLLELSALRGGVS